MTDRITQLRSSEVKADLLPQATINCSLDYLRRAKHIEFFHAEDDLDEYDVAFLRLDPSVRHQLTRFLVFPAIDSIRGEKARPTTPLLFMLQRYNREPKDTLTIFFLASLQARSGPAAPC